MNLDEATDLLYALPPEEFRARRDALAAELPAAARKQVRGLRRPTVAAYAVNRLAREHADDLDALLALGDRLRGAMAGGGGDVRALSDQRRTAVADLLRAARALTGRSLPAAAEEDVAATLEAATADPTLAEAVRSGRLVKPLRYAGFGALPDLDDALATPVPGRPAARRASTERRSPAPKIRRSTGTASPAGQPSPTGGSEAAAGANPPAAELTRLRTEVLELAGKADDAQRRYDEAVRVAQQARQALDAAERERADAHREARAAHREAERARQRLGRLERR